MVTDEGAFDLVLNRIDKATLKCKTEIDLIRKGCNVIDFVKFSSLQGMLLSTFLLAGLHMAEVAFETYVRIMVLLASVYVIMSYFDTWANLRGYERLFKARILAMREEKHKYISRSSPYHIAKYPLDMLNNRVTIIMSDEFEPGIFS